MIWHVAYIISVGVGFFTLGWGYMQMHYGITPLDNYIGFSKLVIGIILVGLLGIAYITGAIAAPVGDRFVTAMETAFGMMPGGKRVVIQCQCSVEYLGTKAQGHGVYAVMLKKLD